MDQQEVSQIPQEALERIELRRQQRQMQVQERREMLALHQDFMDECKKMGLRFNHIAPITQHETLVLEALQVPGYLKRLNAAKLSKAEFQSVLGLRRPIDYFEAASNSVNATMCYYEDAHDVVVGVAVVGNGDHFCRRVGRELAARRVIWALNNPGEAQRVVWAWRFSKNAPGMAGKEIPEILYQAVKATCRAILDREDGNERWLVPFEV